MSDVPSHIHSGVDLINRINSLESNDFHFSVFLDVESMYTSIPVSEAIENVLSLLHPRLTAPLEPLDIARLLEATLKENVFAFNGKNFRQVSGLPMGNRLSGALACLFLHRLESQVIHNLPLSCYCRYVDDIFFVTSSADVALSILSVFNGFGI